MKKVVLVPASQVKRDKLEPEPPTLATTVPATKSARLLSECSTISATSPLQPFSTKPKTEEDELRRERLQKLSGYIVSLSQTDADEVNSDPESLSGKSKQPWPASERTTTSKRSHTRPNSQKGLAYNARKLERAQELYARQGRVFSDEQQQKVEL